MALQTAQGYVKDNAKDVRIRVMFDTGSHKSFMTSRVAHTSGLSVKLNHFRSSDDRYIGAWGKFLSWGLYDPLGLITV